jgi:glycosyltransferase involved in cell wall biosynthesis
MMPEKINKTLAIAALARDCAASLARNIPEIERLRGCFESSLVVVVENDSVDGTKELLRQWQENSTGVVALEGLKQPASTAHKDIIHPDSKNPAGGFARIEKLAGFRNQYMEYLQNIGRNIDFLMVIDSDVDSFNAEDILKTMNNAPENWTALFANGVKYFTFFGKRIPTRYYDDYAIVPYTGSENPRVEMTFNELKLNREKLEKELRREKYVKCVSAFGGIGIYKYQYVKTLRYKTGPNTKNARFEALCEHISVNSPLLRFGCGYAAHDLFVYHTKLATLKDILLEFLPAGLWLFFYKTRGRK